MFQPPKKYRHRDINGHPLKPETLMMSYGYDPQFSEGSVKCPVFQTSTFAFKTAEDGKAFFELAYGLREQRPTEEPGLIYSRVNNPDLEILEERLGLWDEAESGLVFSSGMAAISTTMFSVLRPGDVLLASVPVYGGTEFLVENILPQFGIQRVWFGSGALGPSLDEAVERARPLGRIAMIYLRRRRIRQTAWWTSPDAPNVARSLTDAERAPAARRGRQHVSGTALAAPAPARRGFRRVLADEVRGRPQRSHRRSLPGQGAGHRAGPRACARSSAPSRTRTRAGSSCGVSKR